MSLEVIPASVEKIIFDKYGFKRLKGRTGEATCKSCGWNWNEGHLIAIYLHALTHHQENPDHMVIFVEDTLKYFGG